MIHNQTTEKKWHAVYTRSRSEKKVNEELKAMGIDCFLPLQKKLHRWKDRKKWVELPLISGYCFVHINRNEYDKVLQIPNVVCYITFEGKAAVIPEYQINALEEMMNQFEFEVEISHNNFEPGQKVEIIRGPLTGLRGELINNRGRHKFLLRIDQINTELTIEIPSNYLSALPATQAH